MSRYIPELGQAMFDNHYQQYEVSELAEAALRAIGDEIERVEWNRTQEQFEAPTGNNGNEYETPVFKMQAYCWCEGSRHEVCPPNFKWGNVEINWYKYLGRGMSASQEIPPALIDEMLTDCLQSIRQKEKEESNQD